MPFQTGFPNVHPKEEDRDGGAGAEIQELWDAFVWSFRWTIQKTCVCIYIYAYVYVYKGISIYIYIYRFQHPLID